MRWIHRLKVHTLKLLFAVLASILYHVRNCITRVVDLAPVDCLYAIKRHVVRAAQLSNLFVILYFAWND